MIPYILECVAFQLVFLLVYDLFLKQETFFQWNRVYLMGTYSVSLLLPWMKIEALRTTLPNQYALNPRFLLSLDEVILTTDASKNTFSSVSWQEGVFLLGIVISLLLFSLKIYQIITLKRNGSVHRFSEYTRVIVENSTIAFSFFKSIFLGDRVAKKDYENIIQHELVHIKQGHTWDLLFFELMRIIAWFNPLVYLYQNRTSELHEYIADAQVAKTNKKEQYQLLLSQVFQTQHISFINPFFKTSLIKKRIVMLQKTKSKKVSQLKYLVLIPMLLGMLVYSSCIADKEGNTVIPLNEQVKIIYEDGTKIFTLDINDLDFVTEEETKSQNDLLNKLSIAKETALIKMVDKEERSILIQVEEGTIVSMKVEKNIGDRVNFKMENTTPFSIVEQVPIFPGCEDAEDKRACFNEKMQLHISKNFNYPPDAQEKGIQGRVNALFLIATDGSIQDIKVRGVDKMLEDEVERIILRLPKMKPGESNGQKVGVPYSIPVTFKLQ
ncbi:M56 family metallopeptidase [Arenibacter sp. GZD96]|uniref:M56 family metallopeptidase n=1 Tax=Aurantibrevibacter litoralis TaxID=3106030 RepID=UPI002AFE458E|nr:M56 family metallopeptidase [Arenibacter sp. GZD-96]MEA1784484.1 M56 family metallopeptidase [Arenibacter sp. GZD-96]